MSALDKLLVMLASTSGLHPDDKRTLAEARAELAALRTIKAQHEQLQTIHDETARKLTRYEMVVCGRQHRVNHDGTVTLEFESEKVGRLFERMDAAESKLRSAVESARAEERERCARIADDHLNDERKALNAGGYIEACMQIAAAIRATGKAAEERRSQP